MLDWQDLRRGPLDIAIHTNYIQISYGPHGFIKDFFMFYAFTSLWKLINRRLDPGAWLAESMLWSSRCCYILNIYGFREEDF